MFVHSFGPWFTHLYTQAQCRLVPVLHWALAGKSTWVNETQRSSASLGLIGMGGSLQPQRLDFFQSWTELSYLVLDETPGTWGQSFVFAPINLAITDHILLRMGPRNVFSRFCKNLQLHRRILFPLATKIEFSSKHSVKKIWLFCLRGCPLPVTPQVSNMP